jgi:hypothetical protein
MDSDTEPQEDILGGRGGVYSQISLTFVDIFAGNF